MGKPIRLVNKKKKMAQGGEKQPGQVSNKLSRRMGEDHAEVFNDIGKDLYSSIILTVNEDLERLFNEHIEKLESTLKEELGNRGLQEAANYFAPWILEVLEDVIHFGMKDVAARLEQLGNKAAAQFLSDAEEAEEGEEDLFGVDDGVPLEEGEEVEEEEVEEPPEEEEPAEEGEEEEGGEGPGMPEGLEELMEGGEGEGEATTVGPRPRVWRHPKWKNKRIARAGNRYVVKVEDLVRVAGGEEKLREHYHDVNSVHDRLQTVQSRILGKLAEKYPEVQEANPNAMFDWVSKRFPLKG